MSTAIPDFNTFVATRAAARKGYVYLIAAEGRCSRYKIGCSADPDIRIKQIEPMSPLTLSLCGSYMTNDMHAEEGAWHDRLAAYRHHGEWFELPVDVFMDISLEFVLRETENTCKEMAKRGASKEQIHAFIDGLVLGVLEGIEEKKDELLERKRLLSLTAARASTTEE